MTRNKLIETLANHYGITLERKDNGKYNLDTYEWTAGCYKDHGWFSLDTIVEILEPLCEDDDEEDW